MNSSTRRSQRRAVLKRQDILAAFSTALKRTISNLTALTLTLLVLSYLLAFYFNNSTTLLIYLKAYLNREIKSNPGKIEAFALKTLSYVVNIAVSHELKIAVAAAAFIPYALRPRTAHLVLSTVLTLTAVALPSVNANIFFAAAFAYWTYTQFDNAGNKLFALLVCFALIVINIEIDVLEAVHKAHGTPTTTTVKGPSPPANSKGASPGSPGQ